MQKLTRSFATGADSGKDNSRLLADRLDYLAPKMARIQVTHRRWFETSDKVSPQMGEVFVDDDGPPANYGVGADHILIFFQAIAADVFEMLADQRRTFTHKKPKLNCIS